jgi:hypothetical protein
MGKYLCTYVHIFVHTYICINACIHTYLYMTKYIHICIGTKFNYRKQVMGMHMFQHDVEKSFAMWRLLKPTGIYI